MNQERTEQAGPTCIDARALVGTCDIALVTLDTLRWDVAVQALAGGHTPELAELLGERGWEPRHTPGSFTYAAHHAFFAGFLPTPTSPGPHPRLFAATFEGSATTAPTTWVFDAATLPEGLASAGYHTVCIGGVGFFNGRTPLGRVLPALFDESHWSPALGVTSTESTAKQVSLALERVAALQTRSPGRRVFLFVNVSALHQPNCIFTPGAHVDTPDTMLAALAYADRHIGALVRGLRRRAPLLLILTSDHGTAYGDDGFHGHRLAHPTVWTVPYAERLLGVLPP